VNYHQLAALQVGDFVAVPNPIAQYRGTLLVKVTLVDFDVDEDGEPVDGEALRTVRVVGRSWANAREVEFCFFAVLSGSSLEGFRLVDT
jgi:hypothetical protein